MDRNPLGNVLLQLGGQMGSPGVAPLANPVERMLRGVAEGSGAQAHGGPHGFAQHQIDRRVRTSGMSPQESLARQGQIGHAGWREMQEQQALLQEYAARFGPPPAGAVTPGQQLEYYWSLPELRTGGGMRFPATGQLPPGG
jgi:hypothetical protein